MEQLYQVAINSKGKFARVKKLGGMIYSPGMKQPYFIVYWKKKGASILPLSKLIACDHVIEHLIHIIQKYFTKNEEYFEIDKLIDEIRTKYLMIHS